MMSFVCTCVCICAHTLGLSPERFCSVPLQGDAGYHGSCTSSESLPLPLPPLPPSVLFSVLPSLFSFLSFGSPSFCSLAFSLSLCSLDQRHSKQATSHHLRGTVGPRPGSPISGREMYGNYRNVTHIATMLSGKSSMNMGWITISPIFL